MNEAISESVVMKRLEREISRLQSELQEEKLRKNDEVTRLRLQSQILERESQFLKSKKCVKSEALRRRTWCPSVPHSPFPKKSDAETMLPPSSFNKRLPT